MMLGNCPTSLIFTKRNWSLTHQMLRAYIADEIVHPERILLMSGRDFFYFSVDVR